MVLGQNRQRINKDDLRDAIYTRRRKEHHTVTTAVLDHASYYLHKYMGMRLFTNDQKVYLLVNSTVIPSYCRKALTDKECDELAVVFLVLMEIFSSPDGNTTESQIGELLATLDLSDDSIKAYVALLVKRQYIVQEKNDNIQREEKSYRWGPRAVAEVDPDNFMQSFLDLAESGSIDDWPDQKRRIELLKSVRNRRVSVPQPQAIG